MIYHPSSSLSLPSDYNSQLDMPDYNMPTSAHQQQKGNDPNSKRKLFDMADLDSSSFRKKARVALVSSQDDSLQSFSSLTSEWDSTPHSNAATPVNTTDTLGFRSALDYHNSVADEKRVVGENDFKKERSTRSAREIPRNMKDQDDIVDTLGEKCDLIQPTMVSPRGLEEEFASSWNMHHASRESQQVSPEEERQIVANLGAKVRACPYLIMTEFEGERALNSV